MQDFPDVSRQRFPNNQSTSMKELLASDNQYLKSDAEDAERTLRWLAFCKEDKANAAEKMTQAGELQWIAEGIPAAWYAAAVLAKENGITALHKAATFSKFDKRWYGCVSAGKGSGKLARVHMGASQWTDRIIAICFAYRNAIRQLLPQQPNETGWSETKEKAEKEFA